jgi:putative membrane-bound dehydrogenase-like protein
MSRPSVPWLSSRAAATCLAACIFVLCLARWTPPAHAEEPQPGIERLKSSPVLRHLQPNLPPVEANVPGADTVRQMHVPPGFRVELVAAEPDLHQPVAFAFDERGRIWVAEAYSYPTRRPAGQGLDQLVILELDPRGRLASRKVFATGLNLVSGFEVGHGGVWVGAAPELLFIPDRNRDDVPDGPPQVLLDGFGYQDTHECLNSFLWGPDGWLYGIQGVFNLAHIGKPGAPDTRRTELRAGVWRYHPIRHQFEVFAHGGSNPWGLDYDAKGQLFMTHCRSYWGRGGTTHVLQGGQFWNQANANYAPFIVGDPPNDFPGYRNYLLASARYDHGAGGAGAPGSDAIYGGHSHVGTLIYQGDNWPAEYRGHLFTHNLHGHQINQQVNRPLGSGFDTVHAGQDVLFCTDPKYVAIDLQTGPDGAVYFIDWYDQQHCHNPNTERWDRGNGRLYRMAWTATDQPAQGPRDLGQESEEGLTRLLEHPNDWYGRMARRVLHERSGQRRLPAPAVARLEQFDHHPDPTLRLRSLWTRHLTGSLDARHLAHALEDADEYVRGWAVQLAVESRPPNRALSERLRRLASTDPSPVVRRYLASAAPRVPAKLAWDLLERLAAHPEDATDRNLPFLVWHGLAPLLPRDLDRAFRLAATTRWSGLADWIPWYAATLEGDGPKRAVRGLVGLNDDDLRRRLAGLALAVEARSQLAQPDAWPALATRFYAHPDVRIRQLAERVAAVFGDRTRFPALRQTLANAAAPLPERRHALTVLSRGTDPESLPTFLGLLDDASLREPILPVLARFDRPEVSAALLSHLDGFTPALRTAALNTLTRRPAFALALLDAVAAGRVKRDQLGAFQIRQLGELKNPEVDRRVAATWGRIQVTPAEQQARIRTLEKTFQEAPLWAYDGRGGRVHFQKLCASCHVLGPDGARLGPELTGAGKNGIRYFLENLIDPNAVVGSDFEAVTFELAGGDVLSGLVVSETPGAVTVRTTAETRVVPKAELRSRTATGKSLMPEGLLESLNPREQLELLKYLMEH